MSSIALRIETTSIRQTPTSVTIRSPDTVISFPRRSYSPWSDMDGSRSGEGREDFERSGTDSPASSYGDTELEHDTAYCPPLPSSSIRWVSTRPHRPLEGPSDSNSRTKTHSPSSTRKATEEKITRAAHIRSLKLKAKGIRKGKGSKQNNKYPAPEHQREVLRMIFDDITPYPDEAWISKLAIHFNWFVSHLPKTDIMLIFTSSNYAKIKNWFSNTRQKDAQLWRLANPSITDQYNLASTLQTILVEGREMKLRPKALENCAESDWSDDFFHDVVLFHDWMLNLVRTNRRRDDAAYGLLELRLRG